jgi:hypothetical protein
LGPVTLPALLLAASPTELVELITAIPEDLAEVPMTVTRIRLDKRRTLPARADRLLGNGRLP